MQKEDKPKKPKKKKKKALPKDAAEKAVNDDATEDGPPGEPKASKDRADGKKGGVSQIGSASLTRSGEN